MLQEPEEFGPGEVITYIIYPEQRWVSATEVIGWARDSMVNAALKAMGPEALDATDEVIEVLVNTVQSKPEYQDMTLEDAKQILSDEGSVTFRR